MRNGSIKLVVADDHPVVLHGLVTLLKGEPDFKVLAACADGATALEAIFEHSPDVALLDLRLPKMTGLEVLDKVAGWNLLTRVVIITAFTEDRDVLLAVSRGVHGIILKDSIANAVIQCLRTVNAGGRCLPSELVRKELRRQTEAALLARSLTWREREVLRLVAKGLSNKDVAEQLEICEGTLKLHLHHIYRKTAVRSRSDLIALAGKLE
jgi:DNA-binding NarL/FixJ family response regulator